jgi:hypothetical protein
MTTLYLKTRNGSQLKEMKTKIEDFTESANIFKNKDITGGNMALNHNKSSVIRAFQSIYLCCV